MRLLSCHAGVDLIQRAGERGQPDQPRSRIDAVAAWMRLVSAS
jgi:hypothetical protein